MALEGTLNVKDAANIVAAAAQQKDEEIRSLMARIDEMTKPLVDDLFNEQKAKILMSAEYIFFRLRVVVEEEAIKCKQLLNDPNTPPILKTFFTKRSVIMAEISAKLTLMRDDLATLSRFQYNQNWQNQR